MKVQDNQAKLKGVHRSLFLLSVLVYFLIILGGTVRNLNAGLACPDWPLCFGKIIPHFDIQIFSEFFHRLVAGCVSLLFIYLIFKITISKPWRALLGRLSLLAVLILFAQVILGGLTVLHLLKSEIVTLHLSMGTLFFGIILLMSLRARRFDQNPSLFTIAKDKKRELPQDVWRYGLAAMSMLYVQIVLGGMVSSNGAALACSDFPKCNGVWWPGFDGLMGIQFMHRLGALATTLMILLFVYQVKKAKALPASKSYYISGIIIALTLQVALGIGNVMMQVPIWMSVAHLAIAQWLLALILSTTYEIRHYKLHQAH